MKRMNIAQAVVRGIGLASAALVVLACSVDNPCQKNDPALVKKFGVPKEQTEGRDGLCYTVDPDKPNWGSKCDALELCGGGLFCAPDPLGMCTAVGCNLDPKKDKVCTDGFTCIETGNADIPTICIPVPPAPPPAPPAESTAPGEETQSVSESASDGGTGDEETGAAPDSGSDESPPVEPNIGTPCTSATDPVCVGGTFCEAQSLGYCTVMDCASGLANEATCAAASGFCYATAPAPPSGICTVQ